MRAPGWPGEIFSYSCTSTRVLTTDHLAALRQAACDPRVGAGAFELRLTPPTPFLRFIAWGANWRSRLFRLPYGDQAIFVRRDLFLALGGFAHRHPEDLDLVLRLRRLTRLRLLTPPVTQLRPPLAQARQPPDLGLPLGLPDPPPGRTPPHPPLAQDGAVVQGGGGG